MGFSHERGAAVRTLLRARAVGDPRVIEDAEVAISGFLDVDETEEFDHYVEHHAPHGLPVTDPVVRLVQQVAQYRRADAELTNALAKVLGYPRYEPGEPGYSPERECYVIGDHTAETLVLEVSRRLSELTPAAGQRKTS